MRTNRGEAAREERTAGGCLRCVLLCTGGGVVGPPGYPAQGLRREAMAPGDPGLQPCGLQAWEKLWSWTAPGGRGIAASELAAVA